jgi:hypothetical protein
MKWVILWLVLAVVFLVGIGSFNLSLFHGLMENGVRQQAIATKLTPEFHNTVCYEYQVNGTKFEGRDQSWNPNPPLTTIKVGQSLVIYYDPQNPSRSVLGNPGPMLTNELIAVGMITLVIPTIVVFRLKQYQRRRLLKGKKTPG